MIQPRDANWKQRRSIALLREAIVTLYVASGDPSKVKNMSAISAMRVLYVKRWARHISSFLGVNISIVEGSDILSVIIKYANVLQHLQ